MNIIFQNQGAHQTGKSDAAAAYNSYAERDAGRMQRIAEERKSKGAAGLAGSVNVSFSVGESNLNMTGCLGDDKGNGEKKSFMDIQQQAAATDAGVSQDYMTLMSNTMSAKDYQKASEDGFDFSDMDPDEAVTIVDKIKAELVRSGQQIAGYTDDLDLDTLAAAVGSQALAQALTESFQNADLPLTQENAEALRKAWNMAQELQPPTDGVYQYMVDNEMEPEIRNFYLAQNSGAGYTGYGTGGSNRDMAYLADENIQRQMDQLLEQAGYEVNAENRKSARWLLEKDLPLTQESMDCLHKLQEAVIPATEEVFAQAAADAVLEGKEPIQASLAQKSRINENIYEKAVRVLEYYNSDAALAHPESMSDGIRELSELGGDLAARKQLEEIRLRMTAEVNVRLLRSGFAIDTAPMEQLIDALREAEKAVADHYFPKDIDAVSKYENWNQVNQVVKDIPDLPVQLLGTVNIEAVDGEAGTVLARFHEDGVALQQAYQKAGESYERLMTAPRSDLGDSMEKAFGNVDDLLRELGLEPAEENSKAVRVLGYNHMEITVENIERVQKADAQIQNLVRKMTPAATLQMIRDGVNPLEKSFDQLNRYFDSLPEDFRSQSESYSRYLYGLEQNHQITQQERESYIGVYRLLHQIEKKDGAAVGAVLNNQAELQFANLLSAVRSGQFRHMDVKASDEYGTLKELVQKGERNSISGQISRGYEQAALKEMRGAVKAEASVVQMLERCEFPASAENLLAARKLAKNEENPFRTVKKFAERAREGVTTQDVEETKGDGEQSGTSSEVQTAMAAGPEKLWEQLSNKETFQMLYSDAVDSLKAATEEIAMTQAGSSLDVRALRVTHKQLSVMGSLSRREEYFLPMEVGDREALVHLTLESGGSKKGVVDIAVAYGENARVEAHLQVKNNRLEGFFVGRTPEEVMKLKKVSDIFYNLIQEDASIQIERSSLHVVGNGSMNLAKMSETDGQEASGDSDNGTLYRVAKLFLQAIR